MDNFLGIPIPVYCEHSNLEFLAEPLNAISNIAFIFAGLGIYRLLTKNRIQQVEFKAVFILILFLGFGSFLWHILDALAVYLVIKFIIKLEYIRK